ncbi:MAG: hypothetical protein KGO05_13515, partial [Chloroflexota bacterium]|nr:hypothetical protein [Chloroflexota bacterium]
AGRLTELLGVRPVAGRSVTVAEAAIVTTLGLGLIGDSVAGLTFGSDPQPVPSYTSTTPLLAGGVPIRPLFVVMVAATLLIALFAALLARQATLRPQPTTTPTPHATPVANGVWQEVAGYGGQQGLALAPSNPNVAYQFWFQQQKGAAPILSLRRTENQGKSWSNLTPPSIPGVTYPNIEGPFFGFVSPIDPQVVYLIIGAQTTSGCGSNGISAGHSCQLEFVSPDGGHTWRPLTLPTPGLLTASALNINGNSGIAGNIQAQGKRLYGAITSQGLGSNAPPPPARLVASDDGGLTWKLIDSAFRAAGQGVYTYSAAPAGGEVFAATESLSQPASSANPTPAALILWRSVNGGRNWTQLGPMPFSSLTDMRAAWDATNSVPVIYLAATTGGGKSVIAGSRGGALSGLVIASATPAGANQTGTALLTTLADGSLLIENSGGVYTWNVTPEAEAAGWSQVAQPDGLFSLNNAFTQAAANGATRLWLTGMTQSSFVAEWAQLSSGATSAPTTTPTTSHGPGAWTSASSLAQAASVAPASLRIQYNASLGATSKTSSPQYILQRSDDWGQTWKDLTPPQIPGVTYPDSLNTIIGAESPVNPQVFILTLQLNGVNYSVCPKNSGRVCQLQYVTANGGATWQKLTLPAPGLLGLQLPFGFSGTNLAAQGSRLYSVVNQVTLAASGTPPPGRLVVSDDGGVTWRLADSALAARGLLVYFYAVSPSGSSAYVVAGPNDANIDLQTGQLPPFSLWRSADAGATWTKGATLPAQTDNIQMLAVDNQATGKNSLYLLTQVPSANAALLSYSGDSGATWSASTPITSTNDPNTLLASLPSGAVLIGGGGDSGPGLVEWNGTAKTPTTLTQPPGIERVDSAYVTPLSGGKVQIFLIGHDRTGQGYWEYTQLTP